MKKAQLFNYFPAVALLGAVVFSPLFAFGAESSEAYLKALQIIPNFQQVSGETPEIYRGGNPIDGPRGVEGMSALAALGVKTDIDLQGGDVDGSITGWFSDQTELGEDPRVIQIEAETAENKQIKFEPIPLDSHAPVGARAGASIQRALEIMHDPSRRPVFIHCEHGLDRTGLVIALYRVIYQGWTPANAKAEWVRLGHGFKNRLITGDLDHYFDKITKKIKR